MQNKHAEDVNSKRWDELAALHAKSDYYRVNDFLNDPGFSTLSVIEQDEIGDIENKTLLHLQCHIGIDTLSLARRGAKVTGIDFSLKSIEEAKLIAEKSKLTSRFITSNIYQLQNVLNEKFDIVYVNWGSLCWLKDLGLWATIICDYLKPGGMLYLAEIHPFGLLYSRDSKYTVQDTPSYFQNKEKSIHHYAYDKTYTEQGNILQNKDFYQWTYTIGDVVNSICQQNLHIEFLHEHPFAVYMQMPNMLRLDNGLYVLPSDQPQVPLSFTIKASKS